ncbi:MAG: hypothetical protein ACLP07_05355 [Terracidiphilus sp.]
MKTGTVLTEFEARAADALRALLGRFSVIKLIELKHESQPGRGFASIQARVSICGHCHTLACEAHPHGEPARLRAGLREKQALVVPLAADAIPVVVAPYLSPETQALCKQNKIGFLDFEGNARLTVGDFFIVMRSLPREAVSRASTAPQKTTARSVDDPIFPNAVPKISRKQPAMALSA